MIFFSVPSQDLDYLQHHQDEELSAHTEQVQQSFGENPDIMRSIQFIATDNTAAGVYIYYFALPYYFIRILKFLTRINLNQSCS